MAGNEKAKSKSEHDPKKKRAFRSHDDVELLKIILDENPPLRQRILRTIEKHLGKQRLAASKPPAKKPA
ncbi:MAG: hypothetical protein RL189_2577 [Pseudomonadota bacterium]|jgi:hypothetical protein